MPSTSTFVACQIRRRQRGFRGIDRDRFARGRRSAPLHIRGRRQWRRRLRYEWSAAEPHFLRFASWQVITASAVRSPNRDRRTLTNPFTDCLGPFFRKVVKARRFSRPGIRCRYTLVRRPGREADQTSNGVIPLRLWDRVTNPRMRPVRCPDQRRHGRAFSAYACATVVASAISPAGQPFVSAEGALDSMTPRPFPLVDQRQAPDRKHGCLNPLGLGNNSRQGLIRTHLPSGNSPGLACSFLWISSFLFRRGR